MNCQKKQNCIYMKEEKAEETKEENIIDVIKETLLKREIKVVDISNFTESKKSLFTKSKIAVGVYIDEEDDIIKEIAFNIAKDVTVSICKDERGRIVSDGEFYVLSGKESKKLWNILSKDFRLADSAFIKKGFVTSLIKKIKKG